eukprot:CAMPEP_0177648830 /NCGR_PEP_ID=MMETSP0447-20121125/11039_1 /TAXON_ID=0 /ORGANISM="Stygamoeba regulata, Strain BSH-02190019" /LENGTH=117 /DNA_ID=CAMNT_0019151501 /DNA_START=78 /DNA_END=428 /DNA_ORIENTATION=+
MPAGLQTGQSCSNILTHQRWREPSEQETSTPSFLFPGLWQAHAVANYSNRSPQYPMLQQVGTGFAMGFAMGACIGVLFGTGAGLYQGLRAKELVREVGKAAVSSGLGFGFFMGVGSL